MPVRAGTLFNTWTVNPVRLQVVKQGMDTQTWPFALSQLANSMSGSESRNRMPLKSRYGHINGRPFAYSVCSSTVAGESQDHARCVDDAPRLNAALSTPIPGGIDTAGTVNVDNSTGSL
jgi:hypothetical protein